MFNQRRTELQELKRLKVRVAELEEKLGITGVPVLSDEEVRQQVLDLVRQNPNAFNIKGLRAEIGFGEEQRGRVIPRMLAEGVLHIGLDWTLSTSR